jgi:hypothetical protein
MDPKLEETTHTLRKAGFDTELITPPDQAHFGNWVLVATRPPFALRAINDRGVVLLDLMDWDTFKAGANESDWFNWDVVARAIGSQEENGADQLWSFLRNFRAVEIAFLRSNWAVTRELLYKIEAEKRRKFMEGSRMPLHA